MTALCPYRCVNLDGSKCHVDGRLLCGQRKTKACVEGGWEEVPPVKPCRPSRALKVLAMVAGMIAVRGRG